MLYKQIGQNYLLQLEPHEELTRELLKFCSEHGIKNAAISALGAVNSVTLGFYNTLTKEYQEQSFHKGFELSSVNGTLILDGEEQHLHLHATISDKDFRTYGGHLFRAVASKTIEILVHNLDA